MKTYKCVYTLTHSTLGHLVHVTNLQLCLYINSFNAQALSPCDKLTAVCECIMDIQIDIEFIQETRFPQTGDEGKSAYLAPLDYSVGSYPHSTQGGGLVVVYTSTLLCEIFNCSH